MLGRASMARRAHPGRCALAAHQERPPIQIHVRVARVSGSRFRAGSVPRDVVVGPTAPVALRASSASGPTTTSISTAGGIRIIHRTLLAPTLISRGRLSHRLLAQGARWAIAAWASRTWAFDSANFLPPWWRPAGRRAAGPATGNRLFSTRGRSRSACVVNGRLRQLLAGYARVSRLGLVEAVGKGFGTGAVAAIRTRRSRSSRPSAAPRATPRSR